MSIDTGMITLDQYQTRLPSFEGPLDLLLHLIERQKLDISEEKVRLKSHLDYFMEMMEQPTSQGKKLGFISQEIGREINTIGSKANDALIQKYVVGMKEELEKIKEQLLNII